ncbi:MAG: protein-methionine-sulfoxide reductase catalytic subunit MsrP [Candidatus Acidiferrum sp.]
MLIRRKPDLTYADVTPKEVYSNRREFLRDMGVATAAAALAGRELYSLAAPNLTAYATSKLNFVKGPYSTDEKVTPINDVTHYNNFYEFGTGKSDPAKNSQSFRTTPWTVSVEGEVKAPRKFSLDELLKAAPLEERIYRHRCVERWSIVVPWIGYSLSAILKQFEPTPKAKYVAFQSYYDLGQMPQSKYTGLEYPYVEGLRMDEAMHPLTLLCVGMYGETLPNQDGAPVRIIVPWKYGYKSIKSIVKIKLQEKEPTTTWNNMASNEYGFYSNVNPNVDHPRWSQATEHRLGELLSRKTLMFNGYGDQVASLYNGMDLKKYH